jgi:hypothetical protein
VAPRTMSSCPLYPPALSHALPPSLTLSLSMRCVHSSNPRYNVTDYAVFATANLLLSFLLPNVTDPGYLRSVFQAGTPPFAAASKQPCLQHVRGVSAALLVVEA